MIRLFFGDNDYALTQSMRRLRDEFTEGHGEHSVALVEGSDVTMGELPQLLQGQSLFASSQLIVIQGLATNKSVWDGLGDFLETVGDVDLVLVEVKPDKRTRTYKWLQKNAEIREFKPLDEREVANWARTHARTYGVELHHNESQFLVAYSGVEQWRLHHDIEKLALAGKPISRELIQELIDPNPIVTAFDLLDAIIAGRREGALDKLAVVRRTEDPYKFIGLLVSQLYALAVCKTAEHKSSHTIAAEAGIHPFVAQKSLATAQKLSMPKLRDMIAAIEQCDAMIKTSGSDPWGLIETAIGVMMTPSQT